ncbi:unnamed protein product [Withania somnifera]
MNKGFNLVNWAIVQQSRKNGGLGVGNLRLQNKGLLSKWLWRFIEEEQGLLKEVILHKYGQEGHWCTNEATGTHVVGV